LGVNVVADIAVTLSPVERFERFEFLVLSAGILDICVGRERGRFRDGKQEVTSGR
jgi:hypothetical protein